MTARPTDRRPGITLTEVLVSLFVMALGLISLLTLFPLGAIQIGVALKEDRCTQTVAQADALLRAYWQAQVIEKLPPGGSGQPDDFVWAFDDPNQIGHRPRKASFGNIPLGINTYLPSNQIIPSTAVSPNTSIPPAPAPAYPATAVISPTTLIVSDKYYPVGYSDGAMPTPTTVPNLPMMCPEPAPYDSDTNYYYVQHDPRSRTSEPSYPVMLDPLGFLGRTGTDHFWVGGTTPSLPAGTLLIPRRTLSTPLPDQTKANQAIQTCSLLDDLTFAKDGTPETAGGLVTRQGRYNWAAIVQRPANSDTKVANLTILCFDGRPPLVSLPNAEAVVSTGVTLQPPSSGNPGQSSITLNELSLAPPADGSPAILRKGGWFMDGTLETATNGIRNANFYRIVGVTEINAAAGNYQIDFEPPIVPPSNGSQSSYSAKLYFFAGLAEVFKRPLLAPPLMPQPVGP